MKKIIIFLFMLIGMSACSAAPVEAQAVNMTPVPTRERTATSTVVPTATIDHNATVAVAQTQAEVERQNAYAAQQQAINMQQTAVAAGVELARITAEYEAGKIVVAQITQAAYATGEAHVMETQRSQPTLDVQRATAQAIEITRLANQSGLMTQTAGEATRIREIATAKDVAEFGWLTYMAQVIASIAALALSLGLIVFLFYKQAPAVKRPTATIHYAKTDQDGQYRLRRMMTDVPCPQNILLLLAEGIRENQMTLAINQWQGTDVHKYIGAIREFMKPPNNDFAHELKSKNGELMITGAGEDWLDECLALGDAPLPYRTLSPTPLQDGA